ncbi:MAG: hypothetical protein JSU87_02900 [Gemmatimonadota bacterium]|nr:MAG: hypothetical protein JSU87_02900 [Gemmatimonadota bacterium]
MKRQFRVFVWLTAALLAAGTPRGALAQLPFDLLPEELLQVDTAAVRWSNLRSFVGGAEVDLYYATETVETGECKAVALLGLLRLRDHYRRQRETEPVSLRLRLRCARLFNGLLEYDGVSVRLELRDESSGALVYRGRHRGLP